MRQPIKDDYLRIAQGLAVGQTTRVAHKGDRTNRPNLIVYNEPDRWSCYCNSCKQGHSTLKAHVRIAEVAPRESNLPTFPTDAAKFKSLPDWEQNLLAHFLAKKGMDLLYFPEGLAYSRSRQRLLVPTPQGYSGRDITEKSPQKWLVYGRHHYCGWLSVVRTHVVVEDLFSMLKVDHALRMSGLGRYMTAVCSLGTAMAPTLMLELMQRRGAVFFYDGDPAGEEGARRQVKRLRAAAVPAIAACAPAGKDPKDMELMEIINHLKGAYGPVDNEGAVGETTL